MAFTWCNDETAVKVCNASKGYLGKDGKSKTSVLESLNLTVKSGSIYGLLGASGCGKTTLLQCVLGIKSLDEGEIFIYGKEPGTKSSGVPGPLVGYMPQDAAVYDFLSIHEVLNYFGFLYGMSPEAIESRSKFLLDFLQLPNPSRIVKTLSGGQLRRVSLCCALIHHPPLLILDEPTVGVDPLLRASIWEHLVKLVHSEGTTVIITTHYIEEAKRSDTVGILRKGRLLVEEDPEILLLRYNTASLEQVVLKLCHDDHSQSQAQCTNNNQPTVRIAIKRQESSSSLYSWSETDAKVVKIKRFTAVSRTSSMKSVGNGSEKVKTPAVRPSTSYEPSFWKIVWALMMKSIFRLFRYTPFTIFQLLLPVIETVVFQGVVGKQPINLPIGLVTSSEWNGTGSIQSYCSTLGSNQSCFGHEMAGICTFIDEIDDRYVNWLPSDTKEDALALVHEGKSIGVLEFPPAFTNNFRDRLLVRNYADNATLEGSTIGIQLDNTNALNAAIVARRFANTFFSFAERSVAECGGDPRFIQLPLEFNAIYGDDSEEGWSLFPQPALIILFMFILSHAPGISQIMDKRQGFLERDSVAGVHFGHILFSSFLADSMVIFVQIGIFFTILPVFYGMVIKGSWALAVALVYLIALTGLLISRMLATTMAHEMGVILMLLYINITHIISAGAIWPLESVSKWYRIFCLALPVSLPIGALRAIVFKGWGLEHPEVILGFGSSIMWSMGCILVISICSRIKNG